MLTRWFPRRRDPVASVRGPTVAGSDVLATKHQKSRHRDREDREAAAGHERRSRVAAVLLATVRPRAPGLWNRTVRPFRSESPDNKLPFHLEDYHRSSQSSTPFVQLNHSRFKSVLCWTRYRILKISQFFSELLDFSFFFFFFLWSIQVRARGELEKSWRGKEIVITLLVGIRYHWWFKYLNIDIDISKLVI